MELEHTKDLYNIAADGLLDNFGLRIPKGDDAQTKSDRARVLVWRVALKPVAMFLLGHKLEPGSHKPEDLIFEALKLKDALDLPLGLEQSLNERFKPVSGNFDWREETEHIADPTNEHPLEVFSSLVIKALPKDRQDEFARSLI